jgi:hypothetical protein
MRIAKGLSRMSGVPVASAVQTVRDPLSPLPFGVTPVQSGKAVESALPSLCWLLPFASDGIDRFDTNFPVATSAEILHLVAERRETSVSNVIFNHTRNLSQP